MNPGCEAVDASHELVVIGRTSTVDEEDLFDLALEEREEDSQEPMAAADVGDGGSASPLADASEHFTAFEDLFDRQSAVVGQLTN